MKPFFYLLALSFLLNSCNGESSPADETVNTTNRDTVAVIPVNGIDDSLLAKFKMAATLPFVQDSAFLADRFPDNSVALTGAEAKYLTRGFVDTEVAFTGLTPVDNFIFFDSLRTAGAYEDHVATLDIGRIVESTAYVAEKAELNDSTTILLWIVYYYTGDSCPYASAKVLYGSVLRNNEVTSCAILGEDYSGGDPPNWSSYTSFATIHGDGTVTIAKAMKASYGETDEDGNEVVEEEAHHFVLEVDASGVWVEAGTGA